MRLGAWLRALAMTAFARCRIQLLNLLCQKGYPSDRPRTEAMKRVRGANISSARTQISAVEREAVHDVVVAVAQQRGELSG